MSTSAGRIGCINQTKGGINIWHVDTGDRIQKYESINECPAYAPSTSGWRFRSACTFFTRPKSLSYNRCSDDNGHRWLCKKLFSRCGSLFNDCIVTGWHRRVFDPRYTLSGLFNQSLVTRFGRLVDKGLVEGTQAPARSPANPWKSSTPVPFTRYNGGHAFPLRNRFFPRDLAVPFQNPNGDIPTCSIPFSPPSSIAVNFQGARVLFYLRLKYRSKLVPRKLDQNFGSERGGL